MSHGNIVVGVKESMLARSRQGHVTTSDLRRRRSPQCQKL